MLVGGPPPGERHPAAQAVLCPPGALTCRRSLLVQVANVQARSELAHGCGPSRVWQTLSSLQYRLAAVGWEMERGKKKGRSEGNL